MCVAMSVIAALVHAGHTVKRVMWFRVSAEGQREFVHHSDPNQVSLSYRGRTRYENKPGRFYFYCWIVKLAERILKFDQKKLYCTHQLHRGQLLRLLGTDPGREAERCRGLSLQVWDGPATRSMDVAQHCQAGCDRYLNSGWSRWVISLKGLTASYSQHFSLTLGTVSSDLQVQVHPARPTNMFGLGETVFVSCQARGCAAPGRSLALYRCAWYSEQQRDRQC